MTSLTDDLTDILRTIRCHGDFFAHGSTEISPPNLEVDGVGLISLPFQQAQLDQLITRAERAPFGRGEQTVVDTAVRKTWQIDSRYLHFGGRHWQRSLDAIVARAAAGLGVLDPVSAQLYKLLIYDTGSFFVEHRDSEKTPGMFATLALVLPSVYQGGEFVIRHAEREVCLDLGCPDPSDAAFVAFYADCVHEVRPITSGTRLTLIFNLIRTGKAGASAPPRYLPEQAQIAQLLTRWASDDEADFDEIPEKLVYPLEHVYSAAELAFDTLKTVDAAVAKVLVAAAAQADCEIYLGQVAIEESGSAEYAYSGSGRGRYGLPSEDEFEIGEVFDRDATISEWRRPDGPPATLGPLPLLDEELCPGDAFDDEEPDEQEFHEATGNEGVSFDRSYRRAALVLWPRARKLAVVNQAGLAATLPYLEDLAQRWSGSGVDAAGGEADTLAGFMLDDWPGQSGSYQHTGREAARVLDSLTRLNNVARIDAFLARISASGRYGGEESAALTSAATLLEPARAAQLLEAIVGANASFVLGPCADLVAGFARAGVAVGPAAKLLVDTLQGVHVSPAPSNWWRSAAPRDAALVVSMLTAFEAIDAPALSERALEHILSTFSVDEALLPAALTLREQGADFAAARRVRAFVLAHLRRRMALALAPPQDFARPNVVTCDCEYCAPLGRFLADPARADWTLRAAETHRKHVERTIRSDHCDVDCVTLRNGSPHGLMCTKNQASYEARVRQRRDDQANAARLDA